MNKCKKNFLQYINKLKSRLKEISIKLYIKTNILFITYVIINLINSMLLRIVTMGSYFSVKAIISDLVFILLFGSLAYLLKPKNQIRTLFGLTLLMTLICVINAIYYENYVSFASFSLLSTASFLGDMDGSVVTTLIHIKDVILIFPPFVLLIVHSVLKKKNYYKYVEKIERGKKRFLNTIVLGFSLLIFTLILMVPSDYSRLKKQWNREYLVNRFGIYVYQVNDLIRSLEPKFNNLFGYDKASKTFRDFYSEKERETKVSNGYTNIFEGKNVIVIHAESMMQQNMTLSFNNQELTPNLNRIASEGLYFTNFYSQVSVGTSSDSEFTFNTSLLPVSSGTVFVNYWNRTYDAIPSILQNKGYYTASMHANNASFWNRNVMHKTLGYKKFYAKDSYNIDEVIGLGLSDKSFFKQSTEKLKNISQKNQNFYVTLLMLSNHTPFDESELFDDYTVDYKYTETDENGNTTEKTRDYMEGTKLGKYFKSVHYADQAIGEFFAELDEAGLLENTVVVIYGDHDAKLSKKEYSYFYNYDLATGEQLDSSSPNYRNVDYYDYELNRRVPLIIWTKDSKNNKLLNKKINKVMGMYDVMPTLGNMFNFDTKYALGHDIFSIDQNIVVFPNGNWLTDKMYYNAQKEEYLLIKDSVVTEGEIDENKKYANKLLDVSDSLIIYNLLNENSKESINE